MPVVGRIAQLEPLRRRALDAACCQIPPRTLARWGVPQLLLVEIRGVRNRLVQLPVRLFGALTRCGLRNLDPDTPGDLLHRLLKRQSLALHDERENIARFAAAKALVKALRWDDVKRRRFLLVERTERAELAARTL